VKLKNLNKIAQKSNKKTSKNIKKNLCWTFLKVFQSNFPAVISAVD